MSVPNQKTIIINKTDVKPFLKVGIEEWEEAVKVLSPCAFVLYLYLAGNENKYPKELSKEAFYNATGYSKSSYHRAVKELMDLDYIVKTPIGLEFFLTPKHGYNEVIENWEKKKSNLGLSEPNLETKNPKKEREVSEKNTEINNINNNKYNKYKINNGFAVALDSFLNEKGNTYEVRKDPSWDTKYSF